MAESLYREVEDFLIHEAALLDAWQLDDWLELFTEDARYVIPTTDVPDADPACDLVLIDDDLERLRGRVRRLKSRHAHREYPSSRTRHFVSNIRLLSPDDAEIVVESGFIVYRFRGGSSEPFVGQYRHRLVRFEQRFKIRHRRATLDLESLRDQGAVSIIV